IVALSLPRSSAQVVSILGALLAGAGYLPMDDTGPEARKRLVLEDSRAKVLISDANSQECKQLAADLGLHWVAISSFGSFTVTEAQRPALQSGAGICDTGDVAMLIYTSGSTGEPKGIVYDHQHLLHGAWFWAEEHAMSESSVQLFKSPYFWAVMEWEVFPALIRGGKLVVGSFVLVLAKVVGPFIMAEGSFELMPPGEAGEICFGGVLAARYWQRLELTAAKFVPTEDFGRIYRTGDLGRFREGALEVVGRLDRQLKVNGVRVEPGEIE
ncbi:srfAB, partial [Symbiodinium necroappetens]